MDHVKVTVLGVEGERPCARALGNLSMPECRSIHVLFCHFIDLSEQTVKCQYHLKARH